MAKSEDKGGQSKAVAAMDKLQADIETVERLYSDGMPYELDRIENEIKFYMAQTAQSLFESGKRFLRIKAHERHGIFMESLARIGVPSSTAHYAMAAVMKFGPNFQTFGNLGSSKLQALTVFEEEDIKKYVNGGSLGDIPHDDVEKMSVRELKDAIRAERAKHKHDIETREKAIKQKEAKINDMDELLRYQTPLTEKEKNEIAIKAKLENFRKELFTHVQLARLYFGEALETIAKATQIEGVTFPLLDNWAKEEYEELAAFNELFNELDDALNYIKPDKGSGKRK